MFLPVTNILKFSKIVHIINLFDRFVIIIISSIITFYNLFLYLWNNHHRRMKRYQAGINSINQVREGTFT